MAPIRQPEVIFIPVRMKVYDYYPNKTKAIQAQKRLLKKGYYATIRGNFMSDIYTVYVEEVKESHKDRLREL